jgi:hypothetical protein
VHPSRRLPKGWGDLLRQVVLFCGAYYLYRLVRGGIVDHPGAAFEHARSIARFEHAVGLGFERPVSDWATGIPVLRQLTGWSYVYSHFVVTTITLGWLYLRRNESFYFVRNMFTVAMAVALMLYVVVPVAPPRFLPDLGFGDPVADVTGVEPTTSGVLVNPYAAIPSMHVAFALMLAGPMVSVTRRAWAKAVWTAYPVYVTFVVVATANHWWVDAVTGALVAVAAAAAAAALASARPQSWALQPVAETASH